MDLPQRIARLLVQAVGLEASLALIQEAWRMDNPRVLPDDALLSDLELSTRTMNCLTNGDITTVGQIRKMEDPWKELRKIPNFGRRSYNELMNVLSDQ